MAERSAGILLFKSTAEGIRVLAVHPGGPFWRNKDEGAWSIPKGEYGPDEDPFAAACREFQEELGTEPPSGPAIDLGAIRQAAGKLVTAWAVEGDLDVSNIRCNEFEMEWPPRSGKLQSFPEVDRAEWFDLAEAAVRLNRAQVTFLERLADHLA
ncbi:MAG: NUDIX domain-containing protein [Microthrixaceae bacterium]